MLHSCREFIDEADRIWLGGETEWGEMGSGILGHRIRLAQGIGCWDRRVFQEKEDMAVGSLMCAGKSYLCKR